MRSARDVHATSDTTGGIDMNDETIRQNEWRDELLVTGIRGKGGQSISFSSLLPFPAIWLHADGETESGRAVISFGPDHAPMGQRQMELAVEEALTLVPKPTIIVFAAFQFEAGADIDAEGITILKAQMNADLLTGDLKKKRSNNQSFWLIGQPDVELETMQDGSLRVSVIGFDYYNTKTGALESGGSDKIAMWMLDPDYDGRCLFPHQVFFPLAGPKEGWSKMSRKLGIKDLMEYHGTTSLPFDPGEHKRAAVKIMDNRGIESLKIIHL